MRVWVVAVVMLVGLAGQARAAGPVLERVELVGHPVSAVRLHLSAPVPALARTLPAGDGAPERIYIDLQGASIGPHAPTVIQGTGSLLRVRSGQFDERTTRVVLDLTHALPFSVSPVGRAVVVEIGPSLLAPPAGGSARPSATEGRRAAPARTPETVAGGPPPRPVAPARPTVVAEAPGPEASPPAPASPTVTSTPASVAPAGPPAIANVPALDAPKAVDVASLSVPPASGVPASVEPPGPPLPAEVEPTRPADVVAAPVEVAAAPPTETTAAPVEVAAAPVAVDPIPTDAATVPPEATPLLPGPPAPAAPPDPASPGGTTDLALLPTVPAEHPPSPALPSPPAATPPIVVLDAGHGGRDPGAEGVGGVLEKDVVLEVTQRLAVRLPERLAVTVILTRADDSFVSIDRRLSAASEGAALFLSLHANACNDPAARGLEVFYGGGSLRTVGSRATSQTAALLGRCLNRALRDRVGPVRGAARPGDFGVLVRNPLPSALVEIGYLTHPLEAARTQETQYQELLVEALADGVAEFLRASAPPL